jgi:hypothetical protein
MQESLGRSHGSVGGKRHDDDCEHQPAMPRRRRQCFQRIIKFVPHRAFRQTCLPGSMELSLSYAPAAFAQVWLNPHAETAVGGKKAPLILTKSYSARILCRCSRPVLAHLRSHGRRPRRLLTEGTPAAGVTRPIINSCDNVPHAGNTIGEPKSKAACASSAQRPLSFWAEAA